MNSIPLTMVYIDAFLPWDRDMAKRARHTGKGFIRRRIMGNRPLEWTVSEEEIQFRFHMLPEGWMKKTEKLCGRLLEAVAEAAGGNQILGISWEKLRPVRYLVPCLFRSLR